ncbi:MAG: hypothetical protein U5K84_06460 [Alkalibacterium sp.]|nr:hypothetical protein [Alkalibacterium sp.]
MKQTTRARSRFKNLIYSSAILAALSPAVEVNAQGTEPAESNVLMENMDLSGYEPVTKEILEKDEDLMNQDLTLLKLIMTAREQHLEENFELASGLYNLLSTYPELDEALLKTNTY